ncbi:hypothetical protein E4K10_18165 [Streptomyces sp. T1317-0309]|nr:hypothetical protein E4K10_18165 [Streptomyces sp. T1317-0309]
MLVDTDRELVHRDAHTTIGGRRDLQRLPDFAVVIERGSLAGAAVAEISVRDDEARAGEADVTHPCVHTSSSESNMSCTPE